MFFLRCLAFGSLLISGITTAHAQFAPTPTIVEAPGSGPGLGVRLRTGDANNDGIPDLLRCGRTPSKVDYYLGTGNGTFSIAQPVSGPFTEVADALLADYNSDGKADLLVLDNRAKALYLYPNSNSSFPTRTPITSPRMGANGAVTTRMVSGDFTGDGHMDVLVKDHFTVLLFPGAGNGTFDTAHSVIPDSLQTELYDLVTGNFNGDAFPDFAVATSGFMTFLNTGTGSFTYAGTTAGTISFLLAPGDLTGDGIDDMLMADNTAHVFANNGSGVFNSIGLLKPANASYRDFAFADVDGDGKTDVLGVYDQVNRAVWFKNLGSGVLDTQQLVHQEAVPTGALYGCVLRDMNGDSRPDAVWANLNGRIGIQLNTTTPSGVDKATAFPEIQVYPNPAISGKQVWVEVPAAIRISVVNSIGLEVLNANLPAGKTQIALPYPPGTYFLRIACLDKTVVRKVILLE